MKLRILLPAVFLLLVNVTRAQMLDTLRSCINRKVAFTAMFDTRKSFVSAQSARIWGFKFGADFGNRLTIGGGWNTHTPSITKPVYGTDSMGMPDTTQSFLKLDYISYFIRFVFYKNKRWKFSVIPFQLGYGNSRYEYFDGNTNRIIGQRNILIYETGISGSFKIFRWFGVGADLGLRVMLRNNKALSENFNSPIYSFYTIIYWSELYKMVFPNTKLAKRI
ncbi:MAG: hypothetical protein MUC87_01190 [Bacteroidia bacterium]|jgi:hypothetical protein|nr:hypothetical protein [Bacteroidia bacterium]